MIDHLNIESTSIHKDSDEGMEQVWPEWIEFSKSVICTADPERDDVDAGKQDQKDVNDRGGRR